MPHATSPPVSIARQLRGSFRLISVIIAAALAIAVVTLGLSLFAVGPQLSRAIDVNNDDHEAQQAMLNQETGLRAYLFSGASGFLEPYQQGVQDLAKYNARLDHEVSGSPTLEAYLLPARVAQQIWVINWAQPAATNPVPDTDVTALPIIDRGKVLFDRYRVPETEFAAQIDVELAAARTTQYVVLGVAAGLEVLLFVVTLLVTARQHRRLQRDIVRPVDALLAGMRAIRDGDLAVEAPIAGPLELRQLGAGLHDMTEALGQERAVRIAREADALYNAQRLRQILTLAREVAGSLNLRYVLRAVARQRHSWSAGGRTSPSGSPTTSRTGWRPHTTATVPTGRPWASSRWRWARAAPARRPSTGAPPPRAARPTAVRAASARWPSR